MTTQTAKSDAYLRTKVLTAGPEEIRLMLLDGAIKFARQGRDGLLAKDYEKSYEGLSQARSIIMELIVTIRGDVDPDLADRVRGLYTYMFNELVDASFGKAPQKVDEVIKLLEYERETWAMLMKQVAAEKSGEAPNALAERKPEGEAQTGAPADAGRSARSISVEA